MGVAACSVEPASARADCGCPHAQIVRLEGTNVEAGKEILRSSNVAIIAADDLDDAAVKAVAAIQ